MSSSGFGNAAAAQSMQVIDTPAMLILLVGSEGSHVDVVDNSVASGPHNLLCRGVMHVTLWGPPSHAAKTIRRGWDVLKMSPR